MIRVLVTGSSGWLGRHLVPMLRERGYHPFGLDVVPSLWTDAVGSIADRCVVDTLFAEQAFDAVVHSGALHKPDIARFPRQSFVDVNVTGTLNLLEASSATPGIPFVFTSTTSLMISQAIRNELPGAAAWLDEATGPLEPRNIYGVTKLAAEGLCRQSHLQNGTPVVVLRTARFFPEDDDTLAELTGPNMKANELLHRRATVEDMARAHIAAIEAAPRIGFGLYLVSAPTPFTRGDVRALRSDARSVILERFPEAEALYARRGWQLPGSIGRVYDGSLIERELGFAYRTRFEDVLDALRSGTALPVAHDPDYASPIMGG